MSALTDRLDRFVRWFFNSSPTTTEIAPNESRRTPAERDRPHADKPPAPRERRRSRMHHHQRARA